MKPAWFITTLFISSLFISSTASAQNDAPGVWLRQMNKAGNVLSYELAYVSINKQGVESLRYRHALDKYQTWAQLLQMDGPRREVILRGNEISYFEPGSEPFTLNGDHIVDSLPAILFSNIDQLKYYYDFIAVGRSRVADRPCQVIRIVSRDGLRFSYIVWIDETTKLPLRVDLLNGDGSTLEQFRVINLEIGNQVKEQMAGISQLHLPPLLKIPPMESVNFRWQNTWLPQGFKEISRSRRILPSQSDPIESRLFSDGLFSFSVNVNPVNAKSIMREQFLIQGRKTIHTETRDNMEISIVGELPPATAKRIANAIRITQ